MADIKITTDAQETIDQLKDNVEAYKKLLSFQIFRALTVLEKQIKHQLRGPSGLKRRTSRLLNTWGEAKKITDAGNTVVGEMSSAGVPYAAIHEFGGTIVAKGKALAIPLEENRRPDGSPKITIQELFGGLGSKVFTTKGGVVMLASAAGKKGGKYTKLTPMFVFKKSVTIPAHPYVRPALAASKEVILKNFGLFLSATFAPKKGSE